MTSPSRPINIKSPKGPSPSDLEGVSSSPRSFAGTPNNRASLRAPYIGTPPVPNIPPRSSNATPYRTGSPATGTPGFPASLVDRQNVGTPGSLRPFSGSPNPNIDFESLTEEDKARVLSKHLVSKDERGRYENEISSSVEDQVKSQRSGPQSRGPSDGAGPSSPQLQRQGTDQFPIPFSAPGADVT
jgi:solute carrier family 36 (proton-coupled amino acid transporter)